MTDRKNYFVEVLKRFAVPFVGILLILAVGTAVWVGVYFVLFSITGASHAILQLLTFITLLAILCFVAAIAETIELKRKDTKEEDNGSVEVTEERS